MIDAALNAAPARPSPTPGADDFGAGYVRTFGGDGPTLGLFFPTEAFDGPCPPMERQVERAQAAERLGFAALWARDVPLNDPGFGDLGQIYDPFVWLATIAAHTHEIALATGSIILPLHHPIDVAKQATSLDRLSSGRLILGVASGDRPIEYPAYGRDRAPRTDLFRDALSYLRALLSHDFPDYVSTYYGEMRGGDLVPKPLYARLPILGTGNSGQSLDWLAANTDGWITYPRPPVQQRRTVREWQAAAGSDAMGRQLKPVAQSLYLDLSDMPDELPQPIHLGYRMGRRHLRALLRDLYAIGVHHVAFNLKFSRRSVEDVMEELATIVEPPYPNA